MNILVTGANGFIGKNLIWELRNRKFETIFTFDVDSDPGLLDEYCQNAEFVFHLAGINRPKEEEEFMTGNFGFTSQLLDTLAKHKNTCPIVVSSSVQAERDNPYGKSKKAGEDLLFEYGKIAGARVLIYRLPNVFGKWCRPNYNSAVATFCHNIARDLPIQINDPSVPMTLVYIDDVIEEWIRALGGNEHREGDFCMVSTTHSILLGEIAELIRSFRRSREERSIPDMSDAFTRKLYSTYLSYLPKDDFGYDLRMNVDYRGSFTEFIRTPDRGQVSVNISKPGITKGNHWHHTKNEKFLVVNGRGVIRFRQVDSDRIIEYTVSGDQLRVIDIPCGYTHNIENLGDTDMVTVMWANEPFDPDHPDTFFMEV